MSASRSSSMRALKQLSAHSRQTRQLHMTGPATFPSRLLSSNKAAAMPGLSSERGMTAETPNAQTNSPLNTARPLTTTTASPTRPTATPKAPSTTRHFNVSRSLKSPNDTSTIDFAFLPMEANAAEPVLDSVRVPILPHVSPVRTGALAAETPDYERVHRVEINTLAADGTHHSTPSAMAEVHDNNAVAVDFSALAGSPLPLARRAQSSAAGEARSIARELWRGFVDDLTRSGKAVAAV